LACALCVRESCCHQITYGRAAVRALKNVCSAKQHIVCEPRAVENKIIYMRAPASAAAVCEGKYKTRPRGQRNVLRSSSEMIVYLLQAVNLGFTLCQCRTKVFACRRHTHYNILSEKTNKNARHAHSCVGLCKIHDAYAVLPCPFVLWWKKFISWQALI
jgi:hypothetical protein